MIKPFSLRYFVAMLTGFLFLSPVTVVLAQSKQAIPTTTTAPLTLGAAMTIALSYNLTTRTAQTQIVQAQMRLAQAQAQQHFQISLNSTAGVSNGRNLQPPPLDETFGEFTNTLTIPLSIGHKARVAIAQANAQVAIARAQFETARLSLVAQVAAAYYDLLRKQALLKVAEETKTTAERQLSEVQKRFQIGDVPELDVSRAKVPVLTAQSGLIQAETAVKIAEQALNGVMGQSLDGPLAIAYSETPPDKMPLPLEEARTLAVRNSPDVKAAEATIQANELAVKSARLSREPSYALQATDLRSNDQTAFSRLDSLQATITIPLSDGGLTRAQIKEAESVLTQARTERDIAQQTAQIAVSAAYRNAESTLRLITLARDTQDITQTTYDKAVRGYQAGIYPLTDVLNAQSALTQARIAYIQAVYDALAAYAVLNNALGVIPR